MLEDYLESLRDDPRSRLMDAILRKDFAAYEAAQVRGASVNDTVIGSKEPIWWEALKDVGCFSDHDTMMEKMMTDAVGVNVSNINPHMSCRALSNPVFGLANVETSSTAVLASVRESGGLVPIDLPEIFATIGKDEDPYHKDRLRRQAYIETVHVRVAERLNNPLTQLEREAASSFVPEARGYWTKPLAIPDLAELPMPTLAYVKAFAQEKAALETSTHALLAWVKRETENPDQASPLEAVYMSTNSEYERAGAEVDAIRSMGLARIVLAKASL